MDEHGRTYYINQDTNESVWEIPKEDGGKSSSPWMESVDESGRKYFYNTAVSGAGVSISRILSEPFLVVLHFPLHFREDTSTASAITRDQGDGLRICFGVESEEHHTTQKEHGTVVFCDIFLQELFADITPSCNTAVINIS